MTDGYLTMMMMEGSPKRLKTFGLVDCAAPACGRTIMRYSLHYLTPYSTTD